MQCPDPGKVAYISCLATARSKPRNKLAKYKYLDLETRLDLTSKSYAGPTAQEHVMSARVICISRTMSAGAEDVAAEIAKQLQFRCVDEEIIAHAAERHKLDPADVADVEKRKSFFARPA